MNGRSKRIACLSAAVFTTIYTGSLLKAADLTWDLDPVTPGIQDGGSNIWDTSTPNWWNGASNVNWNNAAFDSAIFGSGAAAFTNNANNGVTITTPITVQNINLGVGQNGDFIRHSR